MTFPQHQQLYVQENVGNMIEVNFWYGHLLMHQVKTEFQTV